METDKRTVAVAVAVAAGLMLTGCGKPPGQSQPVAEETTGPATTGAELPAPSAKPLPAAAANETLSGTVAAPGATPEPSPEPPVAVPAAAEPMPVAATNETLSGAAEFMRKSLASPFAQADQALKESYDSALIAVQIGNYDRAVNELKVLAETPDLTPEQKQAVRDLLAQALKAAAEPAPPPGPAAADGAKPETPP